MTVSRAIKTTLQTTGLYPVVRAIYRRFSPSVNLLRTAELDLYRQYLKAGDVVFDVGVNVGQKSELFLALGAKVIGVEPNPNCKSAIDFQFGANPDFTLEQVALGAAPGEAMLNFCGSDSTASLRDDWPYLSVDGAAVSQTPVRVDTLDNLVASYGVPRLCKIDVEGFETEVLKGLTQPLPLVTFEFHLDERDNLERCLSTLAALGAIEVNAHQSGHAGLTYPGWVAPAAFLAYGDLPATADCWVRTAAPS